MSPRLRIGLFAMGLLMITFSASAVEPQVKPLSTPIDATRQTALVGRNVAQGMIVIFELEPAKGMWMRMGDKSVEHPVGAADRFHVEVKPVDPKSKTRIPYAEVTFSALNRTTKKTVAGALHPMWGSSGLHYAANSPLAGDGAYEVTISVGTPAFGRAPSDRDLWAKPVTTKFHFKLADGKLVEVTEPSAEAQ